MEKEYLLEDTDFLVSQTDAHGKIVFANEDFCKIAGYTLHELVGKPHSIVRHPDMPKEAFQALWKTLKGGNIWKGYIKNKTKDGGYYWVFATVYPNVGYKDGKSGYISCRRKANAIEIRTAFDHYTKK
ncbi:MAG: PAS domain-containing protein [Sulfuricurvum sp.]|jgi:aerotaxis receptor|uniref:PAS domain-containing protein n=1 Tax=Sulfuricurvum sp. TaxID=2025608 RepID=UPI0026012279|nr:PAS domain-containing protein [Sulfuricurvum sp.]MCK9372491.1 PAS domain-containing protein [Sulfuricurvum sp.]